MTTAPIFVRAKDVQEVFGFPRSTLYRWAADGAIKIHKRGNLSFVAVADVVNLIAGVGDQVGDRPPASRILPRKSG